MKSRVTLIVTLVSLVVLALLLTYNCSNLANSANREVEHDLYVACQLTGDFSRTDSMENRVETLAAMKAAEGSSQALFASDGTVVYSSDERYSSLTDEDMANMNSAQREYFNVYSGGQESIVNVQRNLSTAANAALPSLVEGLVLGELSAADFVSQLAAENDY